MADRSRLAWLFKSDLKWLSDLKKRLDPISSKPWVKFDSDSRPDHLAHSPTEHSQLVIYDYGQAFVVTLDASADELAALEQRLMFELLPAIGAREIEPTTLPEPE